MGRQKIHFSSQKSLSLLWELFRFRALRMRNSNTLTFIFSEVEEILSQEETDYLELRGVRAMRTVASAGKTCLCEASNHAELQEMLRTMKAEGKFPSDEAFFSSRSSLPDLQPLEEWEEF